MSEDVDAIEAARADCRAVSLTPPTGSSHTWHKFETRIAAAIIAAKAETTEKCAQEAETETLTHLASPQIAEAIRALKQE